VFTQTLDAFGRESTENAIWEDDVELISFVLGVVGFLMTIGVWVWDHRKSAARERALEDRLENMPALFAQQMQQVISAGPPRPDSATLVMHDRDVRVRRVFPSDITGDGQSELLVEYDMGAHSSGLKVFAWRDFDLRCIGELWSDSETAFEIGDFDGDGRNEVRAYQSDPAAFDLPYAARPWVRVIYRWQNDGFTVVASEPDEFAEAI
jgi:hypothetical protein